MRLTGRGVGRCGDLVRRGARVAVANLSAALTKPGRATPNRHVLVFLREEVWLTIESASSSSTFFCRAVCCGTTGGCTARVDREHRNPSIASAN